jgi:hypothetical protein
MSMSGLPGTTTALLISRRDVQKHSSRVWRLLPRRVSFSLFVLVTLAGCDREAESRAEARVLLEQLNTLSGDGSLVARKAALDALRTLKLRDPAHARTRDVCHEAHLQLLDAEASQVSARKTLEEASRRTQPGGSMPAERSQTVALELARSNDALARAKQNFPICEEATQKLVLQAR